MKIDVVMARLKLAAQGSSFHSFPQHRVSRSSTSIPVVNVGPPGPETAGAAL